MKYEEKLDIILNAIDEARKITPQGYQTRLDINLDNKLSALELNDIGAILIQLQDTHKLLTIISPATTMHSLGLDPYESENQDYFVLELSDKFQEWYELHITSRRRSLEKLSFINLLKIYDVLLDIEEKMEIASSEYIFIPLLPSLIRFSILFPVDTIGMRHKFMDDRLETLEFLKSEDILEYAELVAKGQGFDSTLKIKINPKNFYNYVERAGELYKKNKTENAQKDKKQLQPSNEDEIQNLFKKIAEVDEQIKIRREALANAQSTINHNPLYSQATRIGQLARLEQQAQTDIGNFIKQKETYLAELSLRKNNFLTPKNPQHEPSKTTNDFQGKNNTHRITYTQQRQIILNDHTELGKPDFNSENDLVFSFLYEHPNEKFTKEKIEKEVGAPLTKSLHKIVENLGFEGDTKAAFFSVSKDAIQFRNPVTREQLKKMRSPIVKTIKGGGRIILPD